MTVAVHHVLTGPDDAPVVVLSNSLGSTVAMWGPQVEKLLSAGFRVLRYDHRGHGYSPVPAGPYSLAEISRDVIAVLDRLGIATVSFVGLSLGGMVGMWLATHESDRIDKLVCCCCSARPGNPRMWSNRAELVREQGMSAEAGGSVARWFTDQWRAANPNRTRMLRQMTADTPAEGYASCAAALADLDLTDRLPEISAPTLVISGADDLALSGEHGRRIAEGIPGARFDVVGSAAHLANYEQPERINELIVEHVS